MPSLAFILALLRDCCQSFSSRNTNNNYRRLKQQEQRCTIKNNIQRNRHPKQVSLICFCFYVYCFSTNNSNLNCNANDNMHNYYKVLHQRRMLSTNRNGRRTNPNRHQRHFKDSFRMTHRSLSYMSLSSPFTLLFTSYLNHHHQATTAVTAFVSARKNKNIIAPTTTNTHTNTPTITTTRFTKLLRSAVVVGNNRKNSKHFMQMDEMDDISEIKQDGLFLNNNRNNNKNNKINSNDDESSSVRWEVYVDQSKVSLDRGGSATLDAFMALAPSNVVKVHAAIFPQSFFSKTNNNNNNNNDNISTNGSSNNNNSNNNNNNNNNNSNSSSNKNSSRGPCIRVVAVVKDNKNNNNIHKNNNNNNMAITSFDVGNVDSVDKVHRILTKYMQIPGISRKTCECLKWKYKGNGYLEAGKIDLAIHAYDTALTAAGAGSEQEGIVLLMRATAYLQRAAIHRTELKSIVNDLATIVPHTSLYQNLFDLVSIPSDHDRNPPPVNGSTNANANANNHHHHIANAIFRRVLTDTTIHEGQFRQTQYKHGLYQYSLVQAAQDSLRATQLLQNYPNSWILAGEILAELWKLQQSIQYYNRSIELDPTLDPTITPFIDRLYKRQDLLTNSRNYGWSEDTLRLALDVAR